MSDLTNGELGIMITNIANDVTDIKSQTTRTNGRVTKLEAVTNIFYGIILGVPTIVAIIFGFLMFFKK